MGALHCSALILEMGKVVIAVTYPFMDGFHKSNPQGQLQIKPIKSSGLALKHCTIHGECKIEICGAHLVVWVPG